MICFTFTIYTCVGHNVYFPFFTAFDSFYFFIARFAVIVYYASNDILHSLVMVKNVKTIITFAEHLSEKNFSSLESK